MLEELKNNKKIDIYGWFALTIFFIVFNYFLMKNLNLFIDSDMSSELILSQIMSEEKTLLTNSWYYSTELRVFNNQFIFVPLFFLTNSYYLVRVIGTIILELILLASFVFMCNELNIKHIWLYSFFIIGCYSFDYFDYFIKAPHYVPYLFVTFVEIGLLISISKSKSKINKYLKIALFLILALLSSLNGLRQIESLFLPLFIGVILLTILKKVLKQNIINKELTYIIVAGLIVTIIGYLFTNNVLAINYNLQPNQFKYEIVIPNAKDIMEFLYGVFASFGYNSYPGNVYRIVSFLISLATIMLSFIASIDIVFGKTKYTVYDKILTLVFVISSAMTLTLFLFTSMQVIVRYLQLNTVLTFPVIGIYFSKSSHSKLINSILCIMLVFCITNSFIILKYKYDTSTNKELFEMKEILDKDSVNEGIASFWNAAVMNEISDGKIDAWHYTGGSKLTLEDIVEIKTGNWLQNKMHFERFPEGKMFFIIDSDTIVVDRNSIKDYLVYSGNVREMYIFDSYDEFRTILLGQ